MAETKNNTGAGQGELDSIIAEIDGQAKELESQISALQEASETNLDVEDATRLDPSKIFSDASIAQSPVGQAQKKPEEKKSISSNQPPQTPSKPEAISSPFKGWKFQSRKQGGTNNFGRHTGVYTQTGENGKEVRALFKTDKDKNVLLAEFLASALAYRADQTRNPKVELAVAENEVYLSSQFYEGKTQDLYRFLDYKDRPKAIAEQAAAASAVGKKTQYGNFVENLIKAPLGKETFAKLIVPSLLYGDRDRHIGNLLIEGGDITKLRNIDHGAAFGQGAGFDEIVHPHKKLLGNILKRKATNHFLDYPLELRTSQEMAEEILRQTTEGAIEEDVSEFKKSLEKAANKFSTEEFKSFGEYLFKDIKFEKNATKDDILNSITERFAKTLKARSSNLREFACEIAIGRAVERAPTIDGKKDFSKLSEDQPFMSVVKTNLQYFADVTRGAKTIGQDVKDRTKIIKDLKLNKEDLKTFVAGVKTAVDGLKLQSTSYKKPAELSETATTSPNFSAINSFFAPPSAAKTVPQSIEASTSNQVPEPTIQPSVKPEPISLEKKQEVLDSLSVFLADAVADLNSKINSTVQLETIDELREQLPKYLKNLEDKIKSLEDALKAEQNNNELQEKINELKKRYNKLSAGEHTEVLGAKINSEEYKKIISTEYISQMESLRDQIEARISQLQKINPEEIDISEEQLEALKKISLTKLKWKGNDALNPNARVKNEAKVVQETVVNLEKITNILTDLLGKVEVEKKEKVKEEAKKEKTPKKEVKFSIEEQKVETTNQKPLATSPKQIIRPTSSSISVAASSTREPTPKEAKIALDEIIGGLEAKKQINLSEIKTLAELREKFGIPDDAKLITFQADGKASRAIQNNETVFETLKNNLSTGSYQPTSFTDANGKVIKIEGIEFSSKVEPKVEAAANGLAPEPKSQEAEIPEPVAKPLEQSAEPAPFTKALEPQLSENAKALAEFRITHNIPHDAKSVIFKKTQAFGILSTEKVFELTEENISEIKVHAEEWKAAEGQKNRTGWKVEGYVDNKNQENLFQEKQSRSFEAPLMWEKFKQAKPLTKALIIGGAFLIGAAAITGAVISGGAAVPLYLVAIAAVSAVAGLGCLGAGAWKTQKDFLSTTRAGLKEIGNQSAELLTKSSEPSAQLAQKETIFTPSKIDAKLGHTELKSVSIDELKSWKEKFDKKIGENPDWEKLVKKDGYPKKLDPRSIAEEQDKPKNTEISK